MTAAPHGAADPPQGPPAHRALAYRTDGDYAAGVLAFVCECLAAGGRAMVVVPEPNLTLLRDEFRRASCDPATIQYADMAEIGRNPGRILAEMHRFAGDAAGVPAVFVTEPVWPGRSAAEIAEAFAHESLLSRPINGITAILCPYDEVGLDPDVLDRVRRTHPAEAVSRDDPAADLTPVPPDAERMAFDDPHDLAELRRRVAAHGAREGVDGDRLGDLLLAVNELASNTLEHAGPPGLLQVWSDDRSVVCQVTDRGRITDPMVGRLPPPVGNLRGRGLWLVHQLCDLVQLRSGPDGTAVRLHMRRAPGRAPAPATA
jgi:anti-sigma regulatory factor (Ser/Thr protein kinase)